MITGHSHDFFTTFHGKIVFLCKKSSLFICVYMLPVWCQKPFRYRLFSVVCYVYGSCTNSYLFFICREKFSTQLTCHHIGSNPFISLLPHSSQCFVLHQGKKKIVVKLLSSQKVCCQLLTLRTLPKRCPILISFQKILASFDQWPRHRYPSSFRYSDGP